MHVNQKIHSSSFNHGKRYEAESSLERRHELIDKPTRRDREKTKTNICEKKQNSKNICIDSDRMNRSAKVPHYTI